MQKVAANGKKGKGKAKAKTGVKKPHRFRPGTVARREVIRYRRYTKPLCRKGPFYRAVRERAPEHRFTKTALSVILAALEARTADMFETAHKIALNRGKTATVNSADVALAAELVTQ